MSTPAATNGTRMTRIVRITADKIRFNPFDPRHPRSHYYEILTDSITNFPIFATVSDSLSEMPQQVWPGFWKFDLNLADGIIIDDSQCIINSIN